MPSYITPKTLDTLRKLHFQEVLHQQHPLFRHALQLVRNAAPTAHPPIQELNHSYREQNAVRVDQVHPFAEQQDATLPNHDGPHHRLLQRINLENTRQEKTHQIRPLTDHVLVLPNHAPAYRPLQILKQLQQQGLLQPHLPPAVVPALENPVQRPQPHLLPAVVPVFENPAQRLQPHLLPAVVPALENPVQRPQPHLPPAVVPVLENPAQRLQPHLLPAVVPVLENPAQRLQPHLLPAVVPVLENPAQQILNHVPLQEPVPVPLPLAPRETNTGAGHVEIHLQNPLFPNRRYFRNIANGEHYHMDMVPIPVNLQRRGADKTMMYRTEINGQRYVGLVPNHPGENFDDLINQGIPNIPLSPHFIRPHIVDPRLIIILDGGESLHQLAVNGEALPMGGFRDLVRFIDNTHALGTHLGDIKLANILRNDQGIFSLIDQENASDVHTNPANIDWGTFTAEITTNALARALNPHNREFADRRAVLTISDQYATLLSLMIITAARASRIRDIASAPHRVDVFGGPHPGILNAEYRDALLPWVHTYIRPECYGSIEALLTDPLDYVQNPQYLPRLPLAQMIRWDAQ